MCAIVSLLVLQRVTFEEAIQGNRPAVEAVISVAAA